MPSLGLTDRPETFEWWLDANNQNANHLTTPGQRIRILELAAWIRGINPHGSVNYRLCVWDDDGDRIAQTSTFTVTAAPGPNVANLLERTHPLSAPLDLDPSSSIYVGVSWSPGGALQFGWHNHGPAGNHIDDSSTQTGADLDIAGNTHGGTGAIGAYVASYQVLAGAYVRRSGSWVRADAIRVRRSGAWVDADRLQVRRSGAWVDSE